MTDLSQEKCVACRRDAPRVTDAETAALMPTIPEWRIEEIDGVPRLVRAYAFTDWARAWAFASEVGRLAEEEGHHPALLVEWGKVTVSWWTHKIGALHRNDFVMAAKTDVLRKSGEK